MHAAKSKGDNLGRSLDTGWVKLSLPFCLSIQKRGIYGSNRSILEGILVAQMVNIHLQCGSPGLIPGLRRSPGGGQGNPFPYSYLENPMYRGAWWVTVHGVAESWTQLSD